MIATSTQRDGQGRVLVEAGARGHILEELDTAPGWWLVQYEATAQCWPTPGMALRPAPPRPAGRLDLQALQGALVLLLQAIRENWMHTGDEASNDERRAVLAYVMGHAERPRVIWDIESYRPPQCRCGDAGVCPTCDGRGGKCRSCRGSRICRHCPRWASLAIDALGPDAAQTAEPPRSVHKAA